MTSSIFLKICKQLNSPASVKKNIPHEVILDLVCKNFGVSRKRLFSKEQIERVATARCFYSALCLEFCGINASDISRTIGKTRTLVNCHTKVLPALLSIPRNKMYYEKLRKILSNQCADDIELPSVVFKRIRALVCSQYGISRHHLKSKCAAKKVLTPIGFFFKLCNEFTPYSYVELSRMNGSSSKGIPYSALRSLERESEKNPNLHDEYDRIRSIFLGIAAPEPKNYTQPAKNNSGYSYHGERQRELIASR